jgi:hypothetical protein
MAGASDPHSQALAALEPDLRTADPCAPYARDPVQRLRCAWVTGPDRELFVPLEGRSASLRQQMDCLPDRDDPARYAACLGREPADRPRPSAAGPAAPPARDAAVPPAPAPAPARGEGGFAVHVASVRDPANLRDGWRRLAQRHPGLESLGPRRVRAADIPGRGTFYRFLAGAFPTRAAARAACERFRSEGGQCEVLAL